MSDNQACVKFVANLILYARTNNIKMYFHFIQEKTWLGHVQVSYISVE